MSNCNTGTCLFADMCRFTEDNYDPKTCIIGNEMKRRVKVEIAKDAAASAIVAVENVKADIRCEAKEAAKPATKKGGTKK